MKLENIYAQGLFARGVICDDCQSWIVSNDDSGASDEWDKNTCQSTMKKFEIIDSEIHTGRFAHDCFHKGEECEDDCECRITSHSTLGCDACNDQSEGRRHDVLFIRRTLYGRSR